MKKKEGGEYPFILIPAISVEIVQGISFDICSKSV